MENENNEITEITVEPKDPVETAEIKDDGPDGIVDNITPPKKRRKRRKKSEMENKIEEADGKVTQHEVDGKLLRFKWSNGVPELIESIVLREIVEEEPRKFRLRPIPWEFKGLITKKTHIINTGEGRGNLKFHQQNVERTLHNPKLENIVSVSDSNIIRSLLSQIELFEEVK